MNSGWKYRNVVVLLLSLNLTASYALLFRIYDGIRIEIVFLHLLVGAILARVAIAWMKN